MLRNKTEPNHSSVEKLDNKKARLEDQKKHKTVDFSQTHIKKQFAEYLKQRKRDPELIQRLKEHGFCRGFTTLNLYAKWLESQPITKDEKDNPIPRDDFTWLTESLTIISTWDKKRRLTPYEEECFEQVLAKINAYQGMGDILDIRQNDLQLSLSDTQNRVCELEYNLAIRYTPKELMECIGELLPENKLIFISSHNHSMGLIKQGESIFWIDPNLKKGMVDLSSIFSKTADEFFEKKPDEQELKLYWQITHVLPIVILFFAGSGFSADKPSPMILQIFGIKGNKIQQTPEAKYPSQSYFLDKSSILKKTYSNDSMGYANGDTELHLAVEVGNKEIIDYILTQPIAKDINYIEQKDNDDATPLLRAAARNNTDIVASLIKSGADINYENKHGLTPLNSQVANNKMEMVAWLIKMGANINHVNKEAQMSPLSIAARLNLVPMMDFLIQEGADINLKSPDGMTALAFATTKNSIQAVNNLLKRGAICTGCELYFAVRGHLNELIPKFLLCGVDVNSALMYAAGENDVAAERELIALGATYSKAYLLAIESGHTDKMKHLMRYKETQQFRQEYGIHALLIFAAQSKQAGAFMEVLSPHVTPQEGWLNWFISAKKEGIDIVELGYSLAVETIEKLLIEDEKHRNSMFGRFFSSGDDKKLMAADAIAECLKHMDDPDYPSTLLPHKKVLSSSLNSLYKIYQAIYHVQTGNTLELEPENRFKRAYNGI